MLLKHYNNKKRFEILFYSKKSRKFPKIHKNSQKKSQKFIKISKNSQKSALIFLHRKNFDHLGILCRQRSYYASEFWSFQLLLEYSYNFVHNNLVLTEKWVTEAIIWIYKPLTGPMPMHGHTKSSKYKRTEVGTYNKRQNGNVSRIHNIHK